MAFRLASILLLPLSLIVDAQEQVPDPSEYAGRSWPRIAVLGDYVYIEGGEVAQEVGDNVVFGPVNVTLSLPLGEIWHNDTVEFKEIDRGDKPTIKDHTLWTDEKGNKLYQWDGNGPDDDTDGAKSRQLWAFTPDGDGGGEWETVPPENSNVFDGLIRPAGATGATCGDMAYLIGGFALETTDERVKGETRMPIPGMVSLNMTSHEWRNESLAPMSPPYGSHALGMATCVEGRQVSAQAPASHYLFSIGGITSVPDDTFLDPQMMSMSNISFYDQDAGVWRWQMTSGQAPPARRSFCLTGVASPEGTYEIYIHGGLSSVDGPLGDLWVLSLPAFRWFQIEGEGDNRYIGACSVVGSAQKQILFVGGFLGDGVRDPWAQGLGIFDLEELQWSSEYRRSTLDYQSPDFVSEWYESGGMDEVIWSSEEVKSLFAQTSGEDSNDNDSNDSGRDRSSSLGALVGGILGGLVGVLLLVTLIWYIRRRVLRARSKKAPRIVSTNEPDDALKPSYSPLPLSELPPSAAPRYFNNQVFNADHPDAQQPSMQYPSELDAGYRGSGQAE